MNLAAARSGLVEVHADLVGDSRVVNMFSAVSPIGVQSEEIHSDVVNMQVNHCKKVYTYN